MCLLPPLLLTPPAMKAVAALSVRRVAARRIKESVGRRGFRFVIIIEASVASRASSVASSVASYVASRRVNEHCERDEC